MIAHIWSVVCSHAVVDQRSHTVSLLDVVEEITVPDRPKTDGVLACRLDIISLWARSNFDVADRGQTRVIFSSPSGKRREISISKVDLSEHQRARTIVQLQSLPVSEPGRHIFIVECQGEGETEWQQVAAVPVDVSFEPPEGDNEIADRTE